MTRTQSKQAVSPILQALCVKRLTGLDFALFSLALIFLAEAFSLEDKGTSFLGPMTASFVWRVDKCGEGVSQNVMECMHVGGHIQLHFAVSQSLSSGGSTRENLNRTSGFGAH